MALTPTVKDIRIAPVGQKSPRHGAPLGYLSRLKNCEVTQYTHDDGLRLNVKQRNGFVAMPTVLRDVLDGGVDSGSWADPTLLTELGDQLLSINEYTPRVYNGTDFSWYPTKRIVTDRLTSEVRYTSNHTIQASSTAKIGDVEMTTWTETTSGSAPGTSARAGIYNASGAWIRTPFAVNANTAQTTRVVSKVVSDGTHFWVFTAYTLAGDQLINIAVFSTAGLVIDEDTISATSLSNPPVFDVTRAGTNVLFAQWDGGSGTSVTRYALVANAITPTTVTDVTMSCSGFLGWLTNDIDSNFYLATLAHVETWGVFAYRVDATTLLQTHEYNLAYALPSSTPEYCASLSGYVSAGPDVHVMIAILVWEAADSGPLYDPALRYTDLRKCTFGNVATTEKRFQSTIPQTRTFAIGNDYHSINYYQSGSGLNLDQEAIEVAIAPGDVFIGAVEQPIEINPGDYTTGSPFLVNSESGSNSVYVSTAKGSWSIQAGNTVTPEIASGLTGVIDGTQVLKWEFPPETFLATNNETRLSVSGASVSAANGSWLVVNTVEAVNTIYTLPNEIGSLPSGTFTTAGTAQLVALARYSVVGAELTSYITSTDMLGWFAPNGTMEIAGTGGPDDGVKTIRYLLLPGTMQGTYARLYSEVTTEATYNGSFTAEISGNPVNGWHFSDIFDDSMIGNNLRVSVDVQEPDNIGIYEITDTNGAFIIVDATAVRPQLFEAPVPVASIALADPGSALSMTLDDVDVDYSFVGAAVIYVDNNRPENSGTYRVIEVQGPHTLYLQAIVAGTTQHNSDLSNATVTIIKANAQTYPFQSTWIMQPLNVPQALSGAFERGLAYGDWRVEATTEVNLYPFCLSDFTEARTFVLPYRSESVTAQSFYVTPAGTVPVSPSTFGASALASTVGLKTFAIGDAGTSQRAQNILLLPGMLAAEMAGSAFIENNTVVGPEAPWLVSQSESDPGVPGLTVGQSYQVIPVYEFTDVSGQRSWSVQGPALNFKLTGDSNQATYGGRLPIPLGVTGVPLATQVGITDKLVSIALYRTGVEQSGGDFVPTTIHYKITDDLNINGIAPNSATNVSGFSFPDEFTWEYLDSNADALILSSEQLYTDKGFRARYPGVPFSHAVTWQNRTWLLGYDNAIWVSYEHVEGESVSFNPALRIPSPGKRRLVSLGVSEGAMFLFTEDQVWYLPATNNLPGANGAGSLPTPQPTTFTNGCRNLAVTLQDGVAYASTAGGVWFVNRALQNIWLSEDIQESLSTSPILSMHVDVKQRLHVVTASTWFMYDAAVTKTWHEWPVPALGPLLGATWRGQPIMSTNAGLLAYTPGAYADVSHAPVTYPTPPDITFQPFDFVNVRGLKHVWEFQAVGTYKGPHQVNVVLGYPDADEPDTLFAPYTPDPAKPYVVVFNPMVEETSSFELRIYATFTGVESPGNSFELELVSAEVGVQAGGLNKLPDSYRTVP